MNETVLEEKRIYRWFEISMLLKGANATLEIAGGLLVLLVSPQFVQSIIEHFTSAELGADPNDFIATHLERLSALYVSGHGFAALYLLSHGVIKLFLVVALLKNKLWAYPLALCVFGLFTVYQGYLFVVSHAVSMGVLTVFDLIVMWFVWREYQVVRSHHGAAPQE